MNKEQLTSGDLRSLKAPMVHTPKDLDALMAHPLVTATPQGRVIALMAINATYEALAKALETDDEGGNNA